MREDAVVNLWQIQEETFEPNLKHIHSQETVYTIGNGYFATRGTFEEGYPQANPATLLFGVFDAVPIAREELANAPDWTVIKLFVNGERFRLDREESSPIIVRWICSMACYIVLSTGKAPMAFACRCAASASPVLPMSTSAPSATASPSKRTSRLKRPRSLCGRASIPPLATTIPCTGKPLTRASGAICCGWRAVQRNRECSLPRT